MPLETLPIYESWDLTTSPLPTRSYLYSLKPLGMGTAQVESLTSYLARLAQAHGISVSSLIRYLLTPRLVLRNQAPSINLGKVGQPCTIQTIGATNKQLKEGCPTLPNSIGTPGLTEADSFNAAFEAWLRQPKLLQETVATSWLDGIEQVEQIVAVLRKLTLQQDLRYLTLLPLRSLLSLRHVFHTEQLWCPGCYQEYRETGATFYKPLLWALDVVNVCPRHQCYLQIWCLGCHSPQPFLNLQGQMGYCSVCGIWLGRSLQPGVCHSTQTKQTAWDFWVAEAVGQVLAAMPLLPGMNPELCKRRGRKPKLEAFLLRCKRLGLFPVSELARLAQMDFASKS